MSELAGETDDIVFTERGSSTFKGFDEPLEVIEALAIARRGSVPTRPSEGFVLSPADQFDPAPSWIP